MAFGPVGVAPVGGPAPGAGVSGNIQVLSSTGAPTQGAAGTGAGTANIGALDVDLTNGDLYINRASSSSVSWYGVALNG